MEFMTWLWGQGNNLFLFISMFALLCIHACFPEDYYQEVSLSVSMTIIVTSLWKLSKNTETEKYLGPKVILVLWVPNSLNIRLVFCIFNPPVQSDGLFVRLTLITIPEQFEDFVI